MYQPTLLALLNRALCILAHLSSFRGSLSTRQTVLIYTACPGTSAHTSCPCPLSATSHYHLCTQPGSILLQPLQDMLDTLPSVSSFDSPVVFLPLLHQIVISPVKPCFYSSFSPLLHHCQTYNTFDTQFGLLPTTQPCNMSSRMAGVCLVSSLLCPLNL